ncbi:putative nuclease HARBI1 [Prorops nasuta]|uniref:putative nuclease HARBI1 n=1 Tax=Prorops nasuta TaxID=863751 RepID=UPI0034CD1A67
MAHLELRLEDEKSFEGFFRLRIDLFDHLLQLIGPFIQRKNTIMRDCVSPKERLSITLRFLTTGESYRSLEYSTRFSLSTISLIVPETCSIIYLVLRKKYLNTPNTNEEWADVANRYFQLWNFPHCIGAMDGRHIEFKAPLKDGSLYYNYKGTNSIVLLAIVNANYEFIYVNVGVNGRVSDGGVFRESDISNLLKNIENPLNIPCENPLPGMNEPLPYVLLADNAFPLHKNILKPYSTCNLTQEERVFNYRLSRGRRVVESSFGILASRFRVLLTPIYLPVKKVEIITLACCALHNFISRENNTFFHDSIGSMQNIRVRPIIDVEISDENNLEGIHVRNAFKNYFNTIGAIEWQDRATHFGYIN